MVEIRCDCLGMDLRTPCSRPATQEDGLCDLCRANECETCAEAVQFRRWAAENGLAHIVGPIPEG